MIGKMLVVAIFLLQIVYAKDTHVNGYFRSNGTYVQPHYRTSPNSTTYDNYSTKGNVNPYTGEKGYKDPYSSSSNSFGGSDSNVYSNSNSSSKSLYYGQGE